MLAGIKLLHTVVWVLLAGTIVCIPLFTLKRRFRASATLSVIVWMECAVLALNHMRCPLTDLAARYTTDRAPNFDIYLPLWLAANNKFIFGSMFFASQIYLVIFWLRARRKSSCA